MTPPVCQGTTQAHRDAVDLVEFVFKHGGHDGIITLSNDEVARRLGWIRDHGKGHFSADGGRYTRARTHAMDMVDVEGKPCLAYRLHYKQAGRGKSGLGLIDPSGGLGVYAKHSVVALLGWISREKQRNTEIVRIIEQMEQLASWVINAEDRNGYRLLTAAQIELDRTHALSPQLLGELMQWAESAA